MASLIYKIGVLALGTYLQLSEILGNEKSERGNIGRKKWKQNLADLDTKKKTFWIHAASPVSYTHLTLPTILLV